MHDSATVLAGDIGGTKTVLALFGKVDGRIRLQVQETFPSRQAAGIESVIDRFLSKHGGAIAGVCLGIAGPVKDGICKATNLPWQISSSSLKEHFKFRDVVLINDLAAWAYGIAYLNDADIVPLNPSAVPAPNRNQGLIAPGTGLGEALLHYTNNEFTVLSSEGGHVDFAPANEEQINLWRYLRGRFGHVSVERILSGPGICNIFSWLSESGKFAVPSWLAERLNAIDPPHVITEAALNEKEPLCQAVLTMFVDILGAVAGNLALSGTTTGGIFLCGGIPPRILPMLTNDRFLAAFTRKGRFKPYLEQIAVRVVLNRQTPLFGSAHRAFVTSSSA